MAHAESQNKKFEKELDRLDEILRERDQQIAELQRQFQSQLNTLSHDHSLCQQQISDLKAQLDLEQMNGSSSTKTIKDLRDMVDTLREQLNKHGIREPIDYRLRQLGLQGDSGHFGTSSDFNVATRYGPNGGFQ
ncbi:hypothetical protein AAVH_13150 [Aphelenchoides avenae]|nr:hypothetical protein AAVH_13149 [Aphelenchus avenae]KAH7719389.1 hypothetical protein AAVH_13150 [Aphelenchus avenae]